MSFAIDRFAVQVDHDDARGGAPRLQAVELLQCRPQRPTAGQQPARRFGEAAAQRAQPFEADLDLGVRIDEVVVVEAWAIRNGAAPHDRSGLDGSDESEPGEDLLCLVIDLGRRPLLPNLPIDRDDDLKNVRIADLIRRDQVGAKLIALVHVVREAEGPDELLRLNVRLRRR
jgi:hypothetical protein